MITNYNLNNLPMDFNHALSKYPSAQAYFSSLDLASQNLIINHSETIRSKEELDRFVSSLDKGASLR